MAGITAASASETLAAGDTSADHAVGGFITGESILLGTSPTGTDYEWALTQPAASSRARSALSAETGATVTFTPDVAGYYVLTATVDSVTAYILRIAVTSTAISQLVEAIRFSPKTDSSVPAPALGLTMYYSSDQDALCVKDPDDAVSTVDLTVVP
jgi:hypothetical protein